MSVQSSYNTTLAAFYEGQITQQREKADIHSPIVDETAGIKFGRQTFRAGTDNKHCRLPHSNLATLALDADLVTSNVIAGNVIVNGVTTAVTYTFLTSHLASMTALASLIAAVTGIDTAVVGSGSPANRTITITADPDTDAYLSGWAVTLGASQAGVTLTNTDGGDEYGPSVHFEQERDSSQIVQVDAGDAASVGQVVYTAMRSDATLAAGDTPFIRFFGESAADKKNGMLTNAAGSAPTKAIASTKLTVITGCAAGGLAEVRINN